MSTEFFYPPNLNGNKITGVGAGTNATDGVNLSQLQDAIMGLDPKQAVLIAFTSNQALSGVTNGSVHQGETLAPGDRVAFLGQTSGSENGLYEVQASGNPARSADANTADEIRAAWFFVEKGTNAGTLWQLATDPPITLGTTALVFAQFGAGAAYTAGNGLALSGNDFSVNVGDGLEIASDAVRLATPVTVARGGTGAAGASAARINLGATTTLEFNVGDGAATQIDLAHNLNTYDVWAEVYRNSSPRDTISCRVERPTPDAVRLIFAAGLAPSTSQFRAVVGARA